MFIPISADAEHDTTIKHYATNERIEEILSNRDEYMSQFKYDLTAKEILSIASENYNAGINYALNELKLLLDTSLEDYNNIIELIQPIMDKIRKEATIKDKLRKKQSAGGKHGSESKNREYKDAWPLYQVMIDEIFFIKTNKNLTYSHRHACMEVAKQIGEKGFNKVHWKTVEQHTINPKSKNK